MAPLTAGSRWQIPRRAITGVLLALLAISTLTGSCAPGRGLEAIRVLGDIEAGAKPSWLKEATPEPTRAAIVFAVNGREREADFYAPGNAARAGIVLVPGLTPRGRDDARLVAFANTLARARFEVVVPDLPRMRALQVTADDARPIADAAHWLDERGDGRPLGIAAVSFAVGPAILGLREAAAAGHVDFFLGIGGYYDLEGLITYVTTGFYQPLENADWAYRPPKAYGRWVFVLSNARRLADAADQQALLQMARRKLDDRDANIDDLTTGLGADGEAVYALIINTDPVRVPALLAALPAGVREEIARLDLKQYDLSTLNVPFILIHDRHDRIIPSEQSEALAAALPEGQAHTYVIGGLDHAQVDKPGIADALALFDAIDTVLRLRDAPTRRTL